MDQHHGTLLEIITAVQEEIILTDDFPSAFANMLSALRRMTGSELGFVAQVLEEEAGPYLKTYTISDSGWGSEGRDVYEKYVRNGFEFRNLKSLLGRTVETGETFISNAPEEDPDRAGFPAGHPKVESFLSLPLRRGSTVVGVIGLANRPGGFEDHWKERLRPLVQTCGNLIVALQADQERKLTATTLREALDTIPDGFAIYDREDRLVIFNEAYRGHYAASAGAVREGASFEDILRHGLSCGQYPEAGETAEDREDWVQGRLDRHRNPGGSELVKLRNGTWLRVHERRTRSGHVVGLRSDVTELKGAEEAIRQSKAEASRLALVASRTDNGVIITDASGYIEWVNKGFTKITGYSLSEAVGFKPSQLVQGAGTDPDAVIYMRSCLAAGVAFQLELVNYTKTGAPYWVSVDVQPIRNETGQLTNFIGMQRDITARKSAERALQQRETKFRSLFDMAPVGILLTAADGRFVDANDTFLHMTGETRETLMGRHVGDLLDFAAENGPADNDFTRMRDAYDALTGGEDRAKARAAESLAAMLAQLDENGRYGPIECALQHNGGDHKTVLFNATAVRLMDQMPLTWSIVQDISERKRVERVKNEFISVISHELGTPLAVLVGSLGLVKDGTLGQVPQPVASMMRIAHGNAIRLSDLVNDILEMERIHSGALRLDRKTIDLSELLADVVSRLQTFAEQHEVQVAVEAPTGPLMVSLDRRRMSQVLNNLVSNAIKFSHPGGQVHLKVERAGQGLDISVNDRGKGIPEDLQTRIFDKFFQVDSSDSREHTGTGLGLSICQALVEYHGGHISVESGEGGTTFRVSLPEMEPDAEVVPARQAG